jgi:hypothetical protein
MKLKTLDVVAEEAHIKGLEKAQNSKEIKDDRTVLSYGYYSGLVVEEIKEERLQAHTRLMEIIRSEQDSYMGDIGAEGFQALEDAKEKINTLYGVTKNGDN